MFPRIISCIYLFMQQIYSSDPANKVARDLQPNNSDIFYSVYVTANLWNQIFPGLPNPFRESGESLK